jgi:membrane protease YdiL (CAAX protease family)
MIEPLPRALRLFVVLVTVLAAFWAVLLVPPIARLLGVPLEQLQGLGFSITPKPMLIFLGFAALQFLIVFAAQRLIHRERFASLGFRGPIVRPLVLGFGLGLLLVSVQTGGELLAARSVHFAWAIPKDVPVPTVVAHYLFWLTVFLTINSLKEELVFRTYPLEHAAASGVNPILIVVAAAILFAAVHQFLEPFSVRPFVSRALWALLFAQLYWHRRSIWLIAGVHSGTNFLPFSIDGNWKLGGLVKLTVEDGPEWIRICVRAATIAVAMWLIDRHFRRRKNS